VADPVSDSTPPLRATEDAAPITASVTVGGPARGSSRGGSPHADKFRIAIAALIGVAVGAIAIAAVILASNTARVSTPPWSAWSPTSGGTAAATEIADHLAPFYRQSSATQLDVVTVINIANPSATGTVTGNGLEVAVDTGSSAGSLSLLGGHTIAYDLCGIGGSNCAVGGTPSSSRLLLLRREAFELALYTFKYIDTADNVVAVLPPGRTEVASTLSKTPPAANAKASSEPVDIAVLFDRQELQPLLDVPLSHTLAEFPPAVPELSLWIKTEEAGLVDQVTERGLFSEHIESVQDGSNLLVLDPLPPQ
jgi:hypothetical protein